MRGIAVKITIGIIAFALGIAFAVIWICKRPATIPITTLSSSGDCTPVYDANVVVKRIREDDDPKSFAAFQELPLYAMPDCVEEAYSLTWIPSFSSPVLVRVWRSGNRAFMVAKELDSKSWPNWETGKRLTFVP